MWGQRAKERRAGVQQDMAEGFDDFQEFGGLIAKKGESVRELKKRRKKRERTKTPR